MNNRSADHSDMGSQVTIAIDAMGGDFGPIVTIPACLNTLKQFPELKLILVGTQEKIDAMLVEFQHDPNNERLTVVHTSEEVAMHEVPSQALRSKKDSSMRVAINQVKEGAAQACVSAGNTGALMITARFVLKTLPGIDRPAIVSLLPTVLPDKMVRMLDLGANVDSSAENLFQFAVMGSVLANIVGNIDNPKVALLNIGEEEIKGNEQVKETAKLLNQTTMINYVGYVEGDKIMSGEVDVVVCDGFVGNVSLKTIEGVASLVKRSLKESFNRSWWSKFIGLLTVPILKPFARRIDPNRYNGASFLGLNGIVIKSHGNASVEAFQNAIREAMMSATLNLPERIRNKLEATLNQQSPSQGE